jgi:hypothetical protein
MAEKIISEKKLGLWDRIHAKRKRGERPSRPGEKGYPETLNIKEDLAQARKNVGATKCWKDKKIGNPSTKIKGGEEVPNCVDEQLEIDENTNSLSYDWDCPIYENEQRYCPKCQKMESMKDCRYGPKYWSMFSIPYEPSDDYKFNIARIHPTNESKQPDHEHSMARSELSSIISAAKRLKKRMKGEGNIEAWVQSKITRAADYIDAAADYLDSGEHNVHGSMDEKFNKNFSQFINEAIDKSKMKCNSPKSDPVGDSLTGKSHVVKACEDGEEKIIRFGQKGVKGSPKKEGESKEYKNRREKFKARHSKNISKGKMSAAYWADKVKW